MSKSDTPGFRDAFGGAPVAPRPKSTSFSPTEEQERALALFATGESFAIEAGAGTGKTSTLLLLAESARGRRGQYTAFNKSIVTEAGTKFPAHVACNTAHSLAFRAVGRQFQARLNSKRMRSSELAARLRLTSMTFNVGGSPKTLSPWYLGSLVMRTIDRFCQTADPKPSTQHVPYIDGIDIPDDETGRRGWDNNMVVRDHLMSAVLKAWEDIQDPKGQLPFKHGHYLKMWQLGDPVINADFILFDEVQDADPVMADIVMRQKDRGVQVVLVGDSQQEIYGWRGAVNAFQLFGLEHTTFLTQSFRFGNTIAEIANSILTALDAPLRLKGLDAIESRLVDDNHTPDAILCRTNATAIRIVLNLQRGGIPVHLMGGGADVLAFARAAEDLAMKGSTGHPELACFDSWGEVQDYVANDPQGSDLKLMVDLIEEFGSQVIEEALGKMSYEGDAVTTVSTAHKAKGREWEVVMLAPDFGPRANKETGMPMLPGPEEMRLLYVAVTRAMRGLNILSVPQLTGGAL